jgi:hypothetical protein
MANYGIAMGFRPAQIENPVNQLAKVLQIQGMQDQQSLNRLQADEYRRKVSDTTAINEAWRGAVGPDGSMNRTALIQRLASGGQGSAIPGVQKQFLEADKAQGDLDHRKLETAHKRVEMVGQGFGWLRQQPTLENARVLTQGLVRQGIAPPEMAQQMLAEIEANPTPENISRLATMAYQQALSAKDQLPKYETRNTGGTTDTIAIDPVSGGVRVANQVRNTASPESILSAQTQRRGQDLTDTRARDFNAIQQDANNIKRAEKKEVQDLTKNSQIASMDTMLGTLDRLSAHPGLSRSVGATGAFPTMPGSQSANFQAELNTFQSQAFIPMVAQLKGMGALSDAEGKKLTAAVGALDPKMGEEAFRASVARIINDMEAARERLAGSRRTPPQTGGASGSWGGPGTVVDFGSLK